MTLDEIKEGFAERTVCESWQDYTYGFSAEHMEKRMNEIAKEYAQSKVQEAQTFIADKLLARGGYPQTAEFLKNNPLPLKFD